MTRSLIVTLALLTAAVAGTADRSVTPEPSPLPVAASSLMAITPQVPLLFVVDGRRYQRNELPLLTEDRIFAVRVIKGHAALEGYGRDGAYGVVVITTRAAVTPQA
jgi:hypothetical protein